MMYLLQHLLINSAHQFPDRPAVVYNGESISYRELNQVTNKLAKVLLENGIKRGDRVGICMDKSIPSIISIYGVLKAGAIYVPLDPKAPAPRISYIIQDCGIECLITSTRKSNTIKKIVEAQVPLKLLVNTDSKYFELKGFSNIKKIQWEMVANTEEIQVGEKSGIETDLAYILYTSGSTGVPKGVMISHLNAFTFLHWVQETFNFSENDRLSNHAPIHFDLSILDIFGAAYSGAAVVLVPDMLSTFPIKLADWIEESGISVWYSVPSILTMMLLHGELENHKYKKLRTLIFAGEVFPTKYLRKLMDLIPSAKYYNLYGPTETNVITYYEVPKIPPQQTQSIPIGKVCSNMEVFALMEDGKIVGIPGEEGELYARGSCVARGYWGDIEKTNNSFVINPIQKDFKEIAYRTGDLVTLDEKGNYIFKGRIDTMIKSRGYRIELGEIESILYSCPDIKEAAVIAVPDDIIGNRIQACVVMHDEKKMNAKELRTFCAKKLSQYMIPEVFEFRDVLPKTSTGKVDKVALKDMR